MLVVLALLPLLADCVSSPGARSMQGPDADPRTTRDARFSSAPALTRLTLIHLSDSEAGLLPHAEGRVGGLARARAIIHALKARAAGQALVLSAGDLLIPSPELSLELDGQSVILTRNTRLGLQASVLGNHELDLGEQFLADAIGKMNFPYVTASVTVAEGPLRRVVGPTIVETPWADDVTGKLVPRVRVCAGRLARGPSPSDTRCDGTTVGVVGATTEELRLISAGASGNLIVPADLDGVRAAVQAEVDALAREGITTVILLSHLQNARREVELVQGGLRGVDVIVAGGGEHRLAAPHHRLLPGHTPDALCDPSRLGPPCYPTVLVGGDGRPVLLVATAGDLDYIGNLDVSLDADGVLVGVDAGGSRPWPVDDTSLVALRADVDADVLAFQRRAREELLPLLEEVAASAVFFDGERDRVRNGETNLANLSADAIHRAAERAALALGRAPPALTLRNGGGIRASIGGIDPRTGARTASPIRVLDVKTALRFDSPIVIADITHASLKRTLESALRGAGTSKGHFPQMSAQGVLRYSADPPEQTQTLVDGRVADLPCPGARVRELVIRGADGGETVVVRDGALPTPNAPIAVATLDYLANGGDGWFPTETVARTALPGITEQSSLRAFLDEEQRAGRWQGGLGYASDVPRRLLRIAAPLARAPAECVPRR